jgi:hypothetical protein
MKRLVPTFIPSEYLPAGGITVLYGPTSDPEINKAWRGFNNCATAHLLCPAKYLKRFEEKLEE